MVSRLLARRARLSIAALGACAVAALSAAPAAAVNTRVSITNYSWTEPEVHIDLGEKVIWDWVGPDTLHSVTGESENALQWDSHPGNSFPNPPLGHEFSVTFDQPGTYAFHCKLHNIVRGDVIVSDRPGDPSSDPGPKPPVNFDDVKPTVGGVRLAKTSFGRKGTGLTADIDERGVLDAEYYRLNPKGKRVYSGYTEWKAFIGINHVRFAARWKRFKARPGRYVAVIRMTDEAANVSKPLKKGFVIRGEGRKRR